jgi:hypothetical protein
LARELIHTLAKVNIKVTGMGRYRRELKKVKNEKDVRQGF